MSKPSKIKSKATFLKLISNYRQD